jgi:hypothetical protein
MNFISVADSMAVVLAQQWRHNRGRTAADRPTLPILPRQNPPLPVEAIAAIKPESPFISDNFVRVRSLA